MVRTATEQRFYGKFSENKPKCNLIQHVSWNNSNGKLKVCLSMYEKCVFKKNSSSTPSRKVKTLHNKSRNTDTRSKHLVSSERLQDTVYKVSGTIEKVKGGLLFAKPAATFFGRNSGNIEKG